MTAPAGVPQPPSDRPRRERLPYKEAMLTSIDTELGPIYTCFPLIEFLEGPADLSILHPKDRTPMQHFMVRAGFWTTGK